MGEHPDADADQQGIEEDQGAMVIDPAGQELGQDRDLGDEQKTESKVGAPIENRLHGPDERKPGENIESRRKDEAPDLEGAIESQKRLDGQAAGENGDVERPRPVLDQPFRWVDAGDLLGEPAMLVQPVDAKGPHEFVGICEGGSGDGIPGHDADRDAKRRHDENEKRVPGKTQLFLGRRRIRVHLVPDFH